MEDSEKWKYEDPHGDDRGILLANRIDELCKKGLLIELGYEEGNLRPASYTLTIGDDFVDSNGDQGRFDEEKDSFVFEKNSVIFVTTKEKLNIPFYIVARFNIRVNWVYDGVLLGTGPQVDPGFSGYLSCPLYNLTNVDLLIKRGDPFATIDFEKTTTLLAKSTANQKKDLIANALDKRLVTTEDGKYSFYKTPPLVPLQHKKAHKTVSSLFEMREEVRTWRRLGIGSVIAFLGLTLSLLGFGANLYRQNSDLTRQVTDARSDLHDAIQKISDLEKAIDRGTRAEKQDVISSAQPDSGKGKKVLR